MAENRSDASRYPSRYSPGGWVTGAQYIIELVCEQKGRHEGNDLPLQFWKNKEWATFFRSQTRATHKLLKTYDEKVIIKVVKEKRIRTLMPKWILGPLDQEQKEFDAAKRQKEIEDRSKPVERERSIIDVPQTRTKRMAGALDNLLALDEEIEHGEEEEG